MKLVTMLAAAAGLMLAMGATVQVRAEGPAGQGDRPPKPAVELKDLTVTGTMMTEVTVQKKDNREITRYYVALPDGGKAFLQTAPNRPAKTKDGIPAIAPANPADFVNKQVTVTGKGTEKDGKKGKAITLTMVESIVEVVAVQ